MKVGIDLIEIERIKIFEDNSRLVKHFTKSEIEYFNKFNYKFTHIAGFFCAKEAFAKALKTGFGKTITPIDIEVLHDEKGAPFINCNTKKLKQLLINQKVELSISHSDNYATAICIIY